jgi:hypothetical protein
LRVNKQISEEARRILYKENTFVEFRIKVSGFTSSFANVPHLKGLCPRQLLSPLLTINITSAKGSSRRTKFVTTSEGVLYVIETLWWLYGELFEDATIVFDCHKIPTNPSQLSLLNDEVLRPFDQIQFHKVEVLGNADDDFVSHLIDYITRGPTSKDVTSSMEEFLLKGKSCFKHEKYRTAAFYLSLVRTYWRYRKFIACCCQGDPDLVQTRDIDEFDKPGKDVLDISDLDIIKSEVPRQIDAMINAELWRLLTRIKLNLYSLSTLYECRMYLFQEGGGYIDGITNIAKACSEKNLTRTPLRLAKFNICSYMMNCGMYYRNGSTCTEARKATEAELAKAVSIFLVYGYCADQLQIFDRTQLARSMDMASLKFMEELGGTLQVADRVTEALESSSSDVLTNTRTLTFWDFLEVAEQPQ